MEEKVRDNKKIHERVIKIIVILVSVVWWIFPIVFMYAQNIKETNLVETFKPCGIMLLSGFIVYAISFFAFRKIHTAGLMCSLLGIVAGNYKYILDLIQRWIPQFRYWHIAILTLIFVSYITGMIEKKGYEKEAVGVLSLVLTVLLVINIVTLVPTGLQKINASISSAKRINIDSKDVEMKDGKGKKSNIYFLLCDEYASFEQLKTDFSYSNEDFRNELESIGFYISDTSENDIDSTHVVCANIMSMDYIYDETSTQTELSEANQNGVLHNVLKDCGYSIIGIGNTSWLGIEATMDVDAVSRDSKGVTFEEMVMQQTFLYMFFVHNYNDEASIIKQSFDMLNTMTIEPDNAVFVLFYVCCPHHPYYFKADGSENTYNNYTNDGAHPERYLGQLEYVNSMILPAITRIIKNDPNCIIVLCSDHGNRFGIKTEKLKTRILNCVYYKGKLNDDFEGLSSLNTIIYILNKENNLNYEYRSFRK